MKKFVVYVQEVWVQPRVIEAKNEEDAHRRVMKGEGEIQENDFEYSDTIAEETWNVEEL